MRKTMGYLILGFVAVSIIVFSSLFNWLVVTITVISILGLAYLYFGKFVRRKPKKRKILDRCGKEYQNMCNAQKHLSNEAKNYKNEYKKLKLEKKRWEEFHVILTDKLDKAKRQFQSELEKKDRHIVHLTRRNAKLESAETASKVKLDFEKDKVKGWKREVEMKLKEISDLERMKKDDLTSFNERLDVLQAEYEAVAKTLLVSEELNHQLCAKLQIEEVPMFKKDLPLLPVFARSSWTSNIYYDGIEDTLNNNTGELSNGCGLNIDDVPPPFAGVEYMYVDIDIVAENNEYQDFQKQWIVTSDSIKTDPCQLSSDSANPLESIPSSLRSMWTGAAYVS